MLACMLLELPELFSPCCKQEVRASLGFEMSNMCVGYTVATAQSYVRLRCNETGSGFSHKLASWNSLQSQHQPCQVLTLRSVSRGQIAK